MSNIITLFQEAAFDPKQVELLSRAYEKARKSLHDTVQPRSRSTDTSLPPSLVCSLA